MDLLDPFSCQLHHIAFERTSDGVPVYQELKGANRNKAKNSRLNEFVQCDKEC